MLYLCTKAICTLLEFNKKDRAQVLYTCARLHCFMQLLFRHCDNSRDVFFCERRFHCAHTGCRDAPDVVVGILLVPDVSRPRSREYLAGSVNLDKLLCQLTFVFVAGGQEHDGNRLLLCDYAALASNGSMARQETEECR